MKFFSKIVPSEDSIIYQTVPEQTRNQNIKTMKVNAQVTVVIATLETLGNIFNFLTWSIWAKITGGNPSFLMVFQGCLLNFVLLPYTFLMNTRYNKNRIIEGGWKVVIQNLKSTHRNRDKLIQKLSRIMPNRRKNKIEPSVYVIRFENKPLEEVCTISKIKDLDSNTSDVSSEIDEHENNNVDVVQSHNATREEGPHCSRSISQSLTPRELNDFRIVRERLLSDLLRNIDIEGLYVRNLMRLIRLEDKKKKGEEIQNIEFIEEDDIFPSLPHFVGNPKRKLSMRKIMIKKLIDKKENNLAYNELFEELMEMEENFVENGC